MVDILNYINSLAWTTGNILTVYISVAIVIFVIGYYVLFDPGATTAGKYIFRFMVSLVGVSALIFVATFIDPITRGDPLALPQEADWWHPIFRFLVLAYVATNITSLAILLWFRKFRLNGPVAKKDPDLVKVRHTQEIPIIESD